MERLICVLVGYVFGLIQTGYIYGKKNGVDLRKKGSGNAGTTNALRTMGWKAGAVTLLGDCFKCVAAVVVVHLIYGKTHTDMMPLLSMYAGMGAVLGHNYPFYLKFKGGKGIAATAGLIISTTNIWIVLICLAAFIAIVAATRYVSLGSMAVVTIYLISVIVYGRTGRCCWGGECKAPRPCRPRRRRRSSFGRQRRHARFLRPGSPPGETRCLFPRPRSRCTPWRERRLHSIF